MANTRKATQRDMFNEVIALATQAGRDDIVEFAEERIAVLDKKNANRKPSKTQAENAELAEVVLANVTATPSTVSEIQARTPELAGFSTQKVSALVKILVDKGAVVKTTDKKKSLFALAESEDANADAE